MSYYKYHLNFENSPNSKEYLLDRCIKVLAMLAIMNDRINDTFHKIKHYNSGKASLYYSKEYLYKFYEYQLKVKARLEQYYNYRLSLVTKF